jgi:ATP adenylyltransferase
VTNAAKETKCIFCAALANPDPNESLIFFRGAKNFLILNRYPYSNGHIMIAPYDHLADPSTAPPETVSEMMRLAQRVMAAQRELYSPDGFNLGMNVGRTAGAGVEDHYHMHVLPRWSGDTNFMATLAETRIIPEDFATTLTKLRPYFTAEHAESAESKKR